jgi:cbb3-type cytochrome oxidase subunit 3
MPGFVRGARFFIHAFACLFFTGTWTATLASAVAFMRKTAAAETATAIIPLQVQMRIRPGSKMKVNRIRFYYAVGTAALSSAIVFRIQRGTLPADGTVVSSANIAGTKDISDATSLATGNHTCIVTPTVDVYIQDGQWIHLEVDFPAAATTVLDFKGALVEYTEPPQF